MKSIGFAAIASTKARVLILGTLPGVRSLERGEYYAHPQNSFWRIMGGLTGAAPELAYQDRVRALEKSGIALWDVCRAAERAGSSDAKILMATVEANDFGKFLRVHPQIELICFNGQPPERFFRRLVLPLPADIRPMAFLTLDSTSPAHAGVTREEKLLRLRRRLAPFIDAQ